MAEMVSSMAEAASPDWVREVAVQAAAGHVRERVPVCCPGGGEGVLAVVLWVLLVLTLYSPPWFVPFL